MLAATQMSQVMRTSVLNLLRMSRSNFNFSSVGVLQPTKLLFNVTRCTSANSKLGCIPYVVRKKVVVEGLLEDDSVVEKLKKRAERILSQLMYYDKGVLLRLGGKDKKILEAMAKEAETDGCSKLLDKEESEYPKILATFYVACKIESLGRRLLGDNIVDNREMLYYVHVADKISPVREAKYQECWMELLKSSKSQLAVELRTRIKEADFTNLDFAYAIARVYHLVLNRYKYSYWRLVPYGPEDVLAVLKSLDLSTTELECTKILLNLDESQNWIIQENIIHL